VAPLSAAVRLAPAYLGTALLLTWPMVLDPAGGAVGHPEASAGCHVWVIWWAQHHLGELQTPLLFYPEGASVVRLYGSDLLSPLLLGRLPLPPTLLYNAWVTLLQVLAGVGLAALAMDRGASRPGAALGGLIFQTAPFFLHELLNGTSEILAAAVLPWFALAGLRALEGGGARAGIALGLSAGFAAATSAYNVFFALLVAIVLLLHRLTTQLGPVLTPAALRAGLLGVGLAGGLFGAPLAVLHARHGAGETLARREDWLRHDPPLPDSFADLTDFVDPRDTPIPALVPDPATGVFEYWTTCTVYVGLVALVLAGLGSRRAPAGGAAPWRWMGLVAAILMLGPELRVFGEAVRPFGEALPLPAVTVAALFPPFVLTALHAYRYAAVLMLAVGVLAAFAVPAGGARRAALLGAAVLGEVLLLGPAAWPVPRTPAPDSPVLRALAAAPPGAVFTAPVEAEHLGQLSELLMMQTLHGKPVHDGGIHHRAGEAASALFEEIPLLGAAAARGDAEWPGPEASAWSLQQLEGLGYRYVLIRKADPEVLARFTELLGAPVDEDGLVARWDLGPPPPPPAPGYGAP
jgi:hypothetical protein